MFRRKPPVDLSKPSHSATLTAPPRRRLSTAEKCSMATDALVDSIDLWWLLRATGTLIASAAHWAMDLAD